MKYTKEDIEKLKSDPIITLLSMFAGKSIEDMVAEINAKYEKEEAEKKAAEVKVQSVTETKPNFPIDKDAYSFLIKCASGFVNSLNKSRAAGFDVNFKDLSLVGGPLAMVYTLLRIFVGSDFAGKFMTGLHNGEDENYFKRIYNEEQ